MVKIVKTLTEVYDEKELQRILEDITDCYEAAKKILEPESDDSTTIEKVLDRTKKRLIAGDTIYLREFMEETGFYISAWNRSPWVDKRWRLTITRSENEEVIGP
jgi:hypothetical protein